GASVAETEAPAETILPDRERAAADVRSGAIHAHVAAPREGADLQAGRAGAETAAGDDCRARIVAERQTSGGRERRARPGDDERRATRRNVHAGKNGVAAALHGERLAGREIDVRAGRTSEHCAVERQVLADVEDARPIHRDGS